jgi:hypothetical protein
MMFPKPPLQKQIQNACPDMRDRDFDYYACDLYVRGRPDVFSWLMINYSGWCDVTACVSRAPNESGHREKWLLIPYAGYWQNFRQ